MSNPKMSETLHHALDVRVASCHFAYRLQMCISYAPHERAGCFHKYTTVSRQAASYAPHERAGCFECGYDVEDIKELTLRTNVRVASANLHNCA